MPTSQPISKVTEEPTASQTTLAPSKTPTIEPTSALTQEPTDNPYTTSPSKNPIDMPTNQTTAAATEEPTASQTTSVPSMKPTSEPTSALTQEPPPTTSPSINPTEMYIATVTAQATTAAPPSPQKLDLSMYGYPYAQDTATQDTADGWVTWPPEADGSYLEFSTTDDITSPEECAAKCQEENAPSGDWSSIYEL